MKEDFFKLSFENLIFLPRDLLMQPTGMVKTTLVEIIPVKFGQNPMGIFREEVV